MNSKILLVKNINIDKEYVNVLSYSESKMLNLCQQNLVAQSNKYSFIRQNENEIYVNFSYQQCLQANYIAFQNTDYGGKWFFAWIDDIIYENDGTTRIKYIIDSWSTWFDYWTKKSCFIVREHVNNDTIGLHTVPENLDIGEVKQESINTYTGLGTNYYFIVFSSFNPASSQEFAGVNRINGNLFGTNIFAFENTTVGVVSLRHFLEDTNSKGKIESVQSINIAPKTLIDNIGYIEQEGNFQGGTYNFLMLVPDNTGSTKAIEIPYIVDKVTSFSDYTPKNNKCFVYPYNYLLVSNNIGNKNIYKYEDFNQSQMQFAIQLALSIGISCRAVPRGYKGIDYNIDESLPLAKYPTCSWSADAFTNWLTDNAVNVATQIVGTGVGVATGNVGSVAGNIASLIGQFREASLLPNIEGGQNNGDVNFSTFNNTFVFHKMRVKTEYLRIIDDYFSRFGYKLNEILNPNIVGRQNWNYIEIGSNEDIGYGTVPSKYMDEINKACRRGVTIWHNHANVGNYSLNNPII